MTCVFVAVIVVKSDSRNWTDHASCPWWTSWPDNIFLPYTGQVGEGATSALKAAFLPQAPIHDGYMIALPHDRYGLSFRVFDMHSVTQ